MSQSRQLAAIMFTDIVGYTALMGNDEQKAFAVLNKNRALQKPIIEQFNGHWIKEIGDGVLASFHTVADAVYAAVKIQEACNGLKEFQLRIGIHLGDILFENDDVFGDGVNIASRIQAIAEPGSIFVSESVHNNISNKKDIQTKFVKEETLKNIKAPVKMYEVITANAPVSLDSVAKEKTNTTQENSIAVLPFANMSSDPEQEYFSDGITEEIITDLSLLRNLLVISRSSIMTYKGSPKKIKEIAGELNVHYILEGSVRKAGNNLRITAQLIDAEKDAHIWAEKYSGTLEDVFAIQENVAAQIVKELDVHLTLAEKKNLAKQGTKNPEAFELYLKGNFAFTQYSPESLNKAIRYFESAIAIDPEFGQPYAGITMCYSGMAWFELMNPREAFSKAKEWAAKTIAIDNTLSEAYNYLGYLSTHDWAWDIAEQQFRKAIELKPNYADAHMFYGWLLGSLARFDEASVEMKKAYEIDPHSNVINANQTFPYYWRREYDKAIAQSQRAIDLDPAFNISYWFLGISNMQAGNYEIAINAFRNAISLSGDQPYYKAWLGHAYANAGNQTEALKILDELKILASLKKTWSYQIALVYLGLGDYEQAMNYLEKTFDEHGPYLVYVKIEPYLDPLRSDQRFQAILKKMKLNE